MKKAPLIFFFLFPSFLSAQNLVLNPSFEETDHCVTESDASKYTNVPSLVLSQCKYWSSFSQEGTADLFQPCNSWNFQNTTHHFKARTGVASGGFYIYDRLCCESEYREYMVGKLKSPLEKGKTYQVSFWLLLYDKSPYASSAVGVYFSQDTVYRNDDFYGVAPFVPQCQNPRGNVISSKQEWTEVRMSYKAQGGESFLMIGNYLKDHEIDTIRVGTTEKRRNDTYYHIDDVCVSAQNCTMNIPLPQYRFRAMVYDAATNKPITETPVELIAADDPSYHVTARTESDAKVRLSLQEKEYLCYTKADCYFPKMDFYSVPLVYNGKKLPEQMQYVPLTRLERGAKSIVEDDMVYTIPEMQNKKNDQYRRVMLRLDKYAEFLTENPSLKISLNAALYMKYVYSEEKKKEVMQKHTTNLDFMRSYWISKGVKQDQVTVKIVELSKETPGASGVVDGIRYGSNSNRYELEVLATGCKTEKVFFERKEKGAVYVLDKVFFTPDSPELEQRSFEELDKLSAFLEQHRNMKIRINGHTDIGKAGGSQEFLQKLSDSRAKAVADYLISKGANKNNISWQGFANRKPIADNSTGAGKALNRRVEVEIIGVD